MAINSTSFVLGILTVLVLIAGVYIYMDFAKSEKKVADYSTKDTEQEDTYIYDKDDKVMEDAIEDSIDKNIEDKAPAPSKTYITGKLCFPSHFLPKGEIVAKNTSNDKLTTLDFDGSKSTYQFEIAPGTYNLRYQAHVSDGDEYSSGYYTKCGINPTADVCDKSDGHDLIPVTVSAGNTVDNIDLCDFYYTDEPEF